MLDVTVQVKKPRWRTLLKPYCKTVEQACAAALAAAGKRKGEMTVVLADDAFVRELNHTYRGKHQPTNVLSFPGDAFPPPLRGRARERGGANGLRPASPPPTPTLPLKGGGSYHLGDIVLALETVEREAKEQGKRARDHAVHLLVHGTLHLLGYDHGRDKEAARMEGIEVKILANLGIGNPYL